ncbi:hypothetical protein [Streptomyces adelaidensis]|uniref:hypothetical protein n=1 Tax=Streptomyces adelaidensis TaxID=2796465 RepID=UPI0019048B61|nr:hypothetical protein [Streptomyces adelaidensis]
MLPAGVADQPGGRRADLDVGLEQQTALAASEATLRLPAVSADSVREGRTPLSRLDGVRFLGHTDGVASYRLPSGRYRLTSTLR